MLSVLCVYLLLCKLAWHTTYWILQTQVSRDTVMTKMLCCCMNDNLFLEFCKMWLSSCIQTWCRVYKHCKYYYRFLANELVSLKMVFTIGMTVEHFNISSLEQSLLVKYITEAQKGHIILSKIICQNMMVLD